jgi:multicomponent Na+:H+ antiporter subunit E
MGKIKGFFYIWIFMILLLLCFTSTVEYQELLAGIFISFVLAIFLNAYWVKIGLPPLTLKRFIFFLWYLIVLIWEIIKANLDVAYRVLHPKMPINPGIVIIKTGLKSDIAKMVLANSITLTPGTFTLDILGDNLLIHWIDVKSESIDGATKIIGEKFEKYLRVIFA